MNIGTIRRSQYRDSIGEILLPSTLSSHNHLLLLLLIADEASDEIDNRQAESTDESADKEMIVGDDDKGSKQTHSHGDDAGMIHKGNNLLSIIVIEIVKVELHVQISLCRIPVGKNKVGEKTYAASRLCSPYKVRKGMGDDDIAAGHQ